MIEYKLSDLFDLQMGKTPSRNNPEYWDSIDNKWLSIGDLSKCGKYISETKEYLSDLAVTESGISLIPVDTVVMSFKLSIGKTAITAEPMYSNEAIMSFRDKHVVDLLPDYIYYMFSGKDWDAGANKAVMGKTLNKATLSNIMIRVHEIEEQRRIVAILDKVSAVLDRRQRELQSFDDLIKARFVEIFGDVKSNPHGFEKKHLKDTCTVVTGNTPSRSVPDYYGDGIEWIKTDNIVAGQFNPSPAVEHLSDEGEKAGRTVEKGTILMACIAGSIASIGRVCITDRKVAFNQQINAVIPKEYDPLFLYVMLQLSKDYLVEEINMSLKGILSKSKLESKEFIVPPMNQQKQFALFVTQIAKTKSAVQKALDETQMLFDSLMQEYFG